MKFFIIVFCIAIISISLIVISRRPPPPRVESLPPPKVITPDPTGKTIWILWLQGWEHAPRLAYDVRQSWINLNPDWNVVSLSQQNLSEFIDVHLHDGMSNAAKSDLIRLNLLSKYGGVWVDSSLLCFMSLDDWIYDALQPVGFWMYHGRDYGRGPASWFIISIKHSYIIQKWTERCNDYWKGRSTTDDYFWMDTIFKELVDSDLRFRHEWECVPYLWCESRGQSHMLAGRVNENNPELKHLIAQNPPYVLKLSFHGFSDDPNTNGNFALDIALSQKGAPYRLHKMITHAKCKKTWEKDKVLVVSDCGNENDMNELVEYCKKWDMELVIYDKCKFCSHVPNQVYTRPLPNIGREQHTFLNFVITFYENLPKYMYFLPTPIHKHHRLERLTNSYELSEDDRSYCHSYGGEAEFELPVYLGKPLERAEVTPFKQWFEKYVGPWDPEIKAICWGGTIRTNSKRIKSKPVLFYQNLLDQLIYNHSEVGHFMERSMGAIF